MTLGNRIGQYRRKLGLTQEALAQKLDVTNQAVSKWESDACCPDISLLPRIADIFDITMDELFGRTAPEVVPAPMPEPEPTPEPEPEPEPDREQPRQTWKDSFWGKLFNLTIGDFDHRTSSGREVPVPDDVELDWEDDQTLRVAIFLGKKLIAGHPARDTIRFCYEGPALNIHSECSIDCGSVGGNVWAGGDVDCGSVSGSVRAGCDVDCASVSGDVQSGGDLECHDILGNVNAGGDVDGWNIHGSVHAGGDVSCDHLDGSICAGGDVTVG